MVIESEALVKGHSEVFNCGHYGQFFPKENDESDRDRAFDWFRKRRTLSYLG